LTSSIAVIPARGGSKGIPRKNLAPLAGRPLLAHTVDAAKQYGRFDHIIVSTEDEEIAALASSLGIEVDHRPPQLATDLAKAVDVVRALLEARAVPEDGSVALLPPTSPLRTGLDIQRALELLKGTAGATSVVSVTEYEFPPTFALARDGEFVRPAFPEQYASGKSQRGEAPALLRPNGAIYAASVLEFRRAGSFLTARTVGYSMPPERSIDVDRPFDLLLADLLLSRRAATERG